LAVNANAFLRVGTNSLNAMAGTQQVQHVRIGTNLVWTYGGGVSYVAISGGVSSNYTENGTNYTALRFATNSTATVTAGGSVEFVIVAGGGGGHAGGGGAGGYVRSNLVVSTGSYSVVVGIGGGGVAGYAAPLATNGGDSAFGALISATGGGRGGRPSDFGGGVGTGGSGGGAGYSAGSITNGGSGISGQGNNGGGNGFIGAPYPSGGGGGAGGIGGTPASASTPGASGAGVTNTLFGNSVYAIGGLGSIYSGGGTNNGANGASNTGNGGGGAGAGAKGGNGGSGVVILRYVRSP
jgi:hypothetical protein